MRTICAFIVIGFQTAFGGFGQRDAGARAIALGGAYVGLANDVWSLRCNAGGLSQLTTNEASFFYSPQPFGLRELSFAEAAIALPTSIGVIGLSGTASGFSLYRELTASIAFARSISGVGVGAAMTYYSVTIKNYGAANTFGIDAGVHVQIVPGLRSGIAVKNINRPTIGVAREPLPQRFSIGLGYTPIQSMTLVADYQKEAGFNPSTSIGFEYWVMESLGLRGGISEEPPQSSAGVSVKHAFLQFDYAFSHHQDLGWSHHGSITVRW
ncbi:MAG TPA: hypothetical protein VGR15_04225 [Bacteroidota bacterium]|jgi:hypothetical protein|nr:hypothetical protein [Bacteroidota bacterium]